MQILKDRKIAEGKNLGNGILKVDGFINHQFDPTLMDSCGQEFAQRACLATTFSWAWFGGPLSW